MCAYVYVYNYVYNTHMLQQYVYMLQQHNTHAATIRVYAATIQYAHAATRAFVCCAVCQGAALEATTS